CVGGGCLGRGADGCWSAPGATGRGAAKPRLHVTIGILHAPTATFAGQGGTLVQSRLEDARIRDCHFSGLNVAAFVYADCGVVAVEDNTVRLTEVGFLFLTVGTIAAAALDRATVPSFGKAAGTSGARVVGTLSLAQDPILLLTVFLATAYPWPSGADAGPTEIEVTQAEMQKRIARSSHPAWEMVERASALYG